MLSRILRLWFFPLFGAATTLKGRARPTCDAKVCVSNTRRLQRTIHTMLALERRRTNIGIHKPAFPSEEQRMKADENSGSDMKRPRYVDPQLDTPCGPFISLVDAVFLRLCLA